MSHTCHAFDCKEKIPPKMFMCRKHWFSLPSHLRSKIWASYRPGQEIDKNPSKQYIKAAKECIDFIAEKER
jgi:hypothetical protein